SARSLSGRHADVVHIVGGGARNSLLCQLTADATGLPVIAGPAEATCFGNVLVQARALGAAPGDLAGMRALIRSTQPLRFFSPAGNHAAAEARTGPRPRPERPSAHGFGPVEGFADDIGVAGVLGGLGDDVQEHPTG
ncbi:MAG: FGGY-family carbohydrate kinase, partial [Streptosporangiaceae bacterium]